MLDPDEYRRRAQECRDMAKAATEPEAKAQFLKSAQAWDALASEVLSQLMVRGRT